MQPTIGRIVHYRLTAEDVEQINRRRTSEEAIAERIQKDKWPLGAQAHIGYEVSADQTYPMIITKVYGDISVAKKAVNGQVFLDGTDVLWVTAVDEGVEPGNWSWPPRV